ncbi:MAG: hypothetical protein O7G85_02990 [Planctomycetota bacterium]|nr:hypothetical protein [Planctomycetota bacterium]
MKHTTRLAVLLALIVLMIATTAYAANCALRNPDRQIYEIFPEATSYRTIVSAVEDEEITSIKEKFGLDLAFSDRGKHSLYIVMKDGVPIGFVHARVEVGVRGSVELVWAADLDLRIRDFRVQRSREKHTKAIKSEAFRAKVVGLDLQGMKALIRPDGQADLVRLGLPSEAQAIANCAITCGLKTLAVSQAAFHEPLTQARLLGTVHQFFPGTAKVKRIADPLKGVDEHDSFTTESLTALRAVDGDGATIGILIRAAGDSEFWCGIDATGTITHAMAIGTSDDEYARSVAALPGMDFATARALESGKLRENAVMALSIARQSGSNHTASVTAD